MTAHQSCEQGLAYPSQAYKRALREGKARLNEPVEQRWAINAEAAIAEFDAADRGQRRSVLRRLAKPLKMSAQYLQNAIGAYRFACSGVVAGVQLKTLPIAIVEELKRWCDFDVAGATAAAEAFASETITVDAFFERAREAREEATRPVSRTAGDFRSRVREAAQGRLEGYSAVSGLTGLAQSSIVLEAPDRSERVAIVVTGPYAEPSVELSQCRETVLQALGLLTFHERVVVACASESAADQALRLLNEVKGVTASGRRRAPLRKRVDVWNCEEHAQSAGAQADGANAAPLDRADVAPAGTDQASTSERRQATPELRKARPPRAGGKPKTTRPNRPAAGLANRPRPKGGTSGAGRTKKRAG